VHGPEHEAIRRRYIETRYELMPYIYTGVEEMSRTGMPLMRPMMLEFPAERVAGNMNEFMFGHDLLIAPKLTEMLDAHTVEFPKGTWFDFWTGKKVTSEKPLELKPALDQLPVFVRGGAVVPRQAVVQNTREIPAGPLTLAVYPDNGCSGSVYTDDGHTFDYKKGAYARFAVECMAENGLTVRTGKTQGNFTPWFKQLEFRVFGFGARPAGVKIDGNASNDFTWNADQGSVSVTVPYSANGVSIAITQ
jgi:alpha-glucosidase